MRRYRIRLARPDEVGLLPAIETVAAGLFRDTPYPWVADDPDGMSLALFKECQEEWNLSLIHISEPTRPY